VNGRGLELRWRLPAGVDGIEPLLREAAAKTIRRGSVQATLTMKSSAGAMPRVNEALFDQVLRIAVACATRIPGAPVPRVETLLSLPGVITAASAEAGDVTEPLLASVKAGFAQAAAALVDARQAEGRRLGDVLLGLIGQIDWLREAADRAASLQPEQHRERLMATVSALLASLPAVPEERIAQEVALLAAKSDVREELDRLGSHIEAARGLLAGGGAVGRQLDFLVQEFVRETNTICSKSAGRDLTSIGLQLKSVVEQVREQAQNLE